MNIQNNKQSERDIRISKIQKIKDFGIIPYAQFFDKKDNIANIISKYSDQKLREIETIILSPKTQVSTAGRITLFRSHGKISFGKIIDATSEIQIMFHRDNCKIIKNENIITETLTNSKDETISAYKFTEKLIDVADFIWIKWELFHTHKWELTIFVSEFKFLSKAIRPLPEKFHWLKDKEATYRQRYLDLTMNDRTYDRFRLRSKFMQQIRSFYYQNDFTEVETSILWNSASWAAAAPFKTHHNDLDIDMYLRISPETALKMLTAWRFEKIFEVAKDFRNEWSDPSHVQEFTMIEHYAAYRNFEDNMKFTEQMFDHIFKNIPELKKKINITNKEWNIKEVNFQTPRARIDYISQVTKDSGIDISKYTQEDEEKLRQDILKKWHNREGIHEQALPTMIDYLYKKVTRPQIIGPAFIYNYPKTMQPLARESDQNNQIVEQRQLLVNWREIIKAYSELVDPIKQQTNFDLQSDAIARWDEEATSWDTDFVLAMEHGMPCQSGRGMWIDRIFSLLTEQSNLRDVILFPLMKPEKTTISDTPVISNEITTESRSPSSQNTNHSTNYQNLPSQTQINQLAQKYLTNTLRHCQQVWKIMKYFAHKLDQDENLRYTAGILHDIDRDHINKNWDLHMWKEFDQIVDEINLPEQLKTDIRSHAHFLTWIQPTTLLAKYLVSVDELSWLIHAYSLMRPTGMEGMKTKSIKKKIKDKNFAAGVDREEIQNCEKFLNISLDEFIPQIIEGMTTNL